MTDDSADAGYDRNRCAELRRQAEQGLAGALTDMADLDELSPQDVRRLVHELKVHQVELELQNEELRRAQLQLEASRDNFRELYELAPVAYLTLDTDGRIVASNLTAVKILGVERRKLLRLPLSRFAAPGQGDCLYLHMQQVHESQSRQRCEMSFCSREGREFHAHVETAPLSDDTDQAGRFLTVLVDISERKQAEELLRKSEAALQVSEEQYRFLANNTTDLIYSLDEQGRFTAVNRSFLRAFKLEEHEIIGKNHRELSVHSNIIRDWDALHWQVLTTGEKVTAELATPMPDGNAHTYEVELTPVFDERGLLAGMRGTSRDITDRKKMEEELLKADKLDAIGILAGGIAHDFNNYLATLMGNITLAKLYREDPAKILGKLENMENTTMRAKDLSNKLFTFAKGGDPFKEKMCIRQLIADDIKFVLSGSQVYPSISIAPDLHMVEADEVQLGQVLSNIAINGAQAMPEGGTLEVRAENVNLAGSAPGIRPPLAAGSYVKISIRDEGTGIPEKYMAKIFDPFFTTKDKGQGLGLASAYSIVKKHGGNLQVECELGVGTTFFIFLPAAVDTPAAAGSIHRGNGKILLMDDEENLLTLTGEILSALGYEVSLARHGAAAVELYMEALEEGRPFNVVILDLTVQGGMGGRQTIGELLKKDPAVKAIVASGYSNDPVMTNYASFGFKESIKKPFTVEELSQAVNSLLV